MSHRKTQIMHRHFSQVNCHFLNKILLHLLFFFFRAPLIHKWGCWLFLLHLFLNNILILLVLTWLVSLLTRTCWDLYSVCT
jgi:hypothetical protein